MKTRQFPFPLALVLILLGLILASFPALVSGATPPPPPTPEIVIVEPNGWAVSIPARASQPEADTASTAITLGFHSSFDPAYRQYTQDLFDAVYPAIVTILGEPYKSGKVCLCPPCESCQDPSCSLRFILLGDYPDIALPYDPSNPNDRGWDAAITHELIHVHHQSVMPFNKENSAKYVDWLEEGLTEASAQLVAEYAQAQNIREMVRYGFGDDTGSIMPAYDAAMLAGREFWGGSPVPAMKVDGVEAYRMSAALFWLVATSQQGAAGGVAAEDWANYDWFRRLNEVAYAWKRAHPRKTMSRDKFYELVDQISPLPIDGQQASNWIKAQPITHYGNPPGHYLGVFPSSYFGLYYDTPVSPPQIECVMYTLDNSDPGQESYYTGPVNGSYSIYDYQGNAVESDTFTTTSGIHTVELPCRPWDPRDEGAYRIVVQANIGGTQRTASSAFICVSPFQEVSDVGLILTHADGTLYQGTAASTSGTFLFNERAGAILRPNNVSVLPQTIDVGFVPEPGVGPTLPVTDTYMLFLPTVSRNWPPDLQPYNLPIPFSRMIVVSKP